ncbi:nitrate transport permease nrtB [Tatumella morbirosei]|uniref:Nitrate transport permease nrtB n=1 Tax=Tatumella morbirosei TaxID=642227 RepID=A0A095VBF0_9GAMM|nr:ABC transporter permease [Tatumella morbirosei]KGD72025.1 nitrate transport permease nrtB [Tatumella morbirosei]
MSTKPRRASLWRIRSEIPGYLKIVLAAAGILSPLVIWIIYSQFNLVDPLFLPSPLNVISAIGNWYSVNNMPDDFSISLERVMGGFFLSSAIAIPLALMMGTFTPLRAFFEPLIDFIRYMPAAAFIPLVMLWFGIDEWAKVMIIFIGTFFQMVLMLAENIRNVPTTQIEASQTMGATRFEIIRYVLLPSASPTMLDTLRITCGWAWTYLVVAELVAANSGLGYKIILAQRYMQTNMIFSGIIIIGIIGLLTDQLFRLLSRILFRWKSGA